ncbi:MAG TPA: VIT domain-containing protein, partial [Polyangia bacterium]
MPTSSTHPSSGRNAAAFSAIAATWNQEERSAGLLNQDQRQVKLVRQELRVEQSWTTATVEIHDQYQNQTNEIQEIFLSFSLPENAVVTGLWLGDSESREKRFAWKVSPRGAAQAVYRGEVRRRADPALVEQVGPGQYRLRAFPVPAKSRDDGQAPPL